MSNFAGAAAAHASRHQASSRSYSGEATSPAPPEEVIDSPSNDDDTARMNTARLSFTSALRHRHPHHVTQQGLTSINPVSTSNPVVVSDTPASSDVIHPANRDAALVDSATHPNAIVSVDPDVTSGGAIPVRAAGVRRHLSTETAVTTASTLRDRAMAGAVGLGLVTAAVGGTYLLSENEAFLPFAIAACVATVSSLLLRYVLSSIHIVTHRPRMRHLRHHRHFTGERAEYVRASQRLAMMDRDFTDADYELLLDLDNHSQRLRRFLDGASEETVARLPTYVYESPEMHECKEKVTARAANFDQMVESEDTVESREDAQSDSLAGVTARKCLICLEDFQDGMMIRTLPCFHRFMADCIDTWLSQQAKCPVCKRSIQEDMNSLPPGVKVSDNSI